MSGWMWKRPRCSMTCMKAATFPQTACSGWSALFRLDFADAQEMRADVAGKSVYLGLMMNAQGVLRLKAQNLLVNLPLRALM